MVLVTVVGRSDHLPSDGLQVDNFIVHVYNFILCDLTHENCIEPENVPGQHNLGCCFFQVATTRLPLPTFSPRAVLMYSAAVGGEGVALQLREATPAELDERLAMACHEPELLADLLHAAADIGKYRKTLFRTDITK